MSTSVVSSSPTRRTLLATVAAAGAFGLVLLAAAGDAQTATEKETTVAQREATTAGVRPFHINVSEEALVDLRRRIAATRWPEQENVADPLQDVPFETIQATVRRGNSRSSSRQRFGRPSDRSANSRFPPHIVDRWNRMHHG